jgi:hypothetical protein
MMGIVTFAVVVWFIGSVTRAAERAYLPPERQPRGMSAGLIIFLIALLLVAFAIVLDVLINGFPS